MTINDLPDFAKKYKTKGYDVRYVNGTYVLFKVSSKRVPDKKYPVLVQEYSMKNYDNLFIANVEDAEKYTDIKNALQKNITIVDKGRNLFKDHRGNIVLKFDEAGYFPCITKTIDYYTGIHLDREELFNEQDHLLKYRR